MICFFGNAIRYYFYLYLTVANLRFLYRLFLVIIYRVYCCWRIFFLFFLVRKIVSYYNI